MDQNEASGMRNPRVILVHGFNVRNGGENTVGRLQPYFENAGFSVKLFRYGWLGLIGVRLLDTRLARLLADMVEPGDIVVGHSNGCLIAHLAAKMGAPIKHMVYINPALDSDTRLAPQVDLLDVWYSPGDRTVKLAALLPHHRWGAMGAEGYRGPYDPRIKSYNKENRFKVSSKSHSDVFEPEKLKFFGPKIVSALWQKIP